VAIYEAFLYMTFILIAWRFMAMQVLSRGSKFLCSVLCIIIRMANCYVHVYAQLMPAEAVTGRQADPGGLKNSPGIVPSWLSPRNLKLGRP
jgi:hypothetical protein